MLEPQTWLAQAQELALGQSAKADHVCGPGRTMRVAHELKGYRAFCFRCDDSGWYPHPELSLAEKLARAKEKDALEASAIADTRPPMPADFQPTGWPDHARLWLYRAGLGDREIGQSGIYYCPRLDRVVLPVVQGDKLAYWQARGFERGRPKYINPPIDKSSITARYGDSGKLIIVEDILSAIKVGLVARGWSILGTTISPTTAASVAAAATSHGVGIWLDPDKAGRTARAKVQRSLSILGIEATIIRTERDPKHYSREEIKRIIYEE